MVHKIKKNKRKVKYCKISFSVSEKEKASLAMLCKYEHSGLKTLCKKAVRLYVKERSGQISNSEECAKNQLSLFEPAPPIQNKLNL